MKRLILVIAMLFPAGLAHGGVSEGDIRDEIYQRGFTLFKAGNFAELDRLADEYRIGKARTLSGVWKLDKLHKAILATVPCTCQDEEKFIAMEAHAKKWIAQNPDSTTAHIVYAAALIKHGWWRRKGDFAYQVPDDAWEPFREYIEKARVYLADRKEQLAVDPRWYATMIQIATDQGWPESRFKAILREALTLHPDYHGIYYQAIRYLSPKWHGSERDLWVLAKYAVGVTAEQEGTGMFARIYWYAADVEFDRSVIIGKPPVWENMPAAMEDVLARYPAQWNIANFARLACIAGDRETTARMMARIDEKLVIRPWGNREPSYKECRRWALGI